MKTDAKKDIIKSIVVLTAICLVVSAALAVVNHFTAPVVAANNEAREGGARRELMPDAARFSALPEYLFEEGIAEAYQGFDADDAPTGYVITVEGTGFGGTIRVMCAIGTDGKIVKCATLDVSGETTTLGGRTAEPAYTDQYIGADASLEGVEAISGATITSTAYADCVRRAFAAVDAAKEAGL